MLAVVPAQAEHWHPTMYARIAFGLFAVTMLVTCALIQDRLAWIAQLARDALRSHQRDDLVLRLRYAPEAMARVREMIRKERICCGFLTIDLCERILANCC